MVKRREKEREREVEITDRHVVEEEENDMRESLEVFEGIPEQRRRMVVIK